MIKMRMAVEQKLDVLHGEAEFRDVLLDERSGFGKATVQQDGALGGSDEERRDVGGAYVVDVADDAEWLNGLVPRGTFAGIALGQCLRAEQKQEKDAHLPTLPRP